jgi:hypothetical protein
MYTITNDTFKTNATMVQELVNLNFPNDPPLKVDGVFGPKSRAGWDKYLEKLKRISETSNWGTTQELDLRRDFAVQHIGLNEIPGNLGFRKALFQDLMVRVGWKRGEAWCAYFAEVIWSLAKEGSEINLNYDKDVPLEHYYSLLQPKNVPIFSGSTQRTLRNFVLDPNHILLPFRIQVEGFAYFAPIGSLPIWQNTKKPTQGHIGVMATRSELAFGSVEGNTSERGVREGGQVALLHNNSRQRGSLWLQGFLV